MSKDRYTFESPLGILLLTANKQALFSIEFGAENMYPAKSDNPILIEAKRQLDQYFKGERRIFNLPLHLNGTDFQVKVWQALQKIGYGKTATYGKIAKIIGNPKAVRAVGGANHRNPIPIIIPCHRIIGKDGTLTGYGGGLDRKKWLLTLEQNTIQNA